MVRLREKRDGRGRFVVSRVPRGARRRLARGVRRMQVRATLETAFAAHRGEIYLARRDGGVELTNGCGRERLRHDAGALLRAIRASIASPGGGGELEVFPVRARGDLFILTSASSPSTELQGRVARASARWRLTPRQREVLTCLALGDANKDIASRLEMGLRTVEQHVDEIRQRAGADSRARLIAKLWSS